MEYHLAAHRQAPESEFAPTIQRLIRDGYLRAGFPHVKVTTSAGDSANGETSVKIEEGDRYRCGKIEFVGGALTSEAIRTDLVKALVEPQVNPGNSSSPIPSFWEAGSPAAFDETAKAIALSIVQSKLTERGYLLPKAEVRLDVDQATHTAALVIVLLDEGIKATLEEFHISYAGKSKNPDDQLLKFLHLEKGLPVQGTLITEITNQLYSCGRFIQHDALLEPMEKPGNFRLHLFMEDLEEAPLLSEPLSTNAMVLLKCQEWLSHLNQQNWDLLATLAVIKTNGQRFELNFGLAKSGISLEASSGPTNSPPQLVYAFTASTQAFSVFSAWRGEKLSVPAVSNRFEVFLEAAPNTAPDRGGRFNLNLGGGFGIRTEGPPLRLRLNLAPCVFLAHLGQRSKLELHNGILEGSLLRKEDEVPTRVKIDAATGRLIELGFESVTNGSVFRINVRTEENGVTRHAARLHSATAAFPEQYDPEYPLSSRFGFMASDLLESPLADSPLLEGFLMTDVKAHIRLARSSVAAAKAALGRKNLAQCLYPLETSLAALFTQLGTNQGENTFSVPVRITSTNLQTGMIAAFAPLALMEIDTLWTPGSWPWSVCREFVFTLSGQSKYTSAELRALLRSEDLGPLGCGAIASILSKLDAGMAEGFARRSLEQLSAEKLQEDLGVLLEPKAGLGRLLGDSLGLLARIRDQDLSLLTSTLGISSSNALATAVQRLRSETNIPPASALAPLIQAQWEPWLKEYLGGTLTNLLRKVATPATAEDALARAVFIHSNAQNPEQAKEALKFLNMAAEQGLPKAEIILASLYESGEAGQKDFSKAMALYRKAAEAHEPHAGCRIADMYREGRGVPQDVGEVVKWLQIEAGQNCGGAQFKLAMYAEQNKDMAQALDLFRRAATNCMAQAQAALGDRLSDGFTVPPNYPEAYLWFFAAAQAGDRFAGASARSLRPKLTPEQIQAAETESYAIIERQNPGEQRRRMLQEIQSIQLRLGDSGHIRSP